MLPKCSLISCAILLLMGWGRVFAEPVAEPVSGPVPAPSVLYPIPSERIALQDYPPFSIASVEMQNAILAHGNPAITNEFCAVGYRLEHGQPISIVIWKTGKLLYFWQGGDAKAAQKRPTEAETLRFSPATDLSNDVVEDDFDGILGTRTLRRADLNGTWADCEQYGTQFTIAPFKPPNESED